MKIENHLLSLKNYANYKELKKLINFMILEVDLINLINVQFYKQFSTHNLLIFVIQKQSMK